MHLFYENHRDESNFMGCSDGTINRGRRFIRGGGEGVEEISTKKRGNFSTDKIPKTRSRYIQFFYRQLDFPSEPGVAKMKFWKMRLKVLSSCLVL